MYVLNSFHFVCSTGQFLHELYQFDQWTDKYLAFFVLKWTALFKKENEKKILIFNVSKYKEVFFNQNLNFKKSLNKTVLNNLQK